MTYVVYPFAVVGFAAVVLLSVGIWLDISDFDRTTGGYAPPYKDVSGEPVDWFALDRTPTGIAKRGYVVDVLVDARTGMITFETFGRKFPFRTFSGRALAVHKPREAFIAMGFEPDF